MKSRHIFAMLLTSILVIGVSPAIAVDATTDRVATVELLKQKYVKVLDEQHAKLLTIKTKMKVDPSLLKQVNAVLADFDTNYSAIINGLANPDQDLQPIIDLCEEEVEEFANSIYLLEQMLKKIKTITCIKGKVTKKIIGLAVACPKGYVKKK